MPKLLMPAEPKTSSPSESDSSPSSTKFKPEIPKFLLQLFDILEEEESSVIKWADDGASLQILDPGRATREILPKYFSHNNFQSFQRQLNYFGFRKWTKTKTYICTFSHPFFKKNEPDLLQYIKRKSVPKRTRTTTAPPTPEAPKEPLYFKRKLEGNCPIRPYAVLPPMAMPIMSSDLPTPTPILPEPDSRPKILPADVIVFANQLPNLSTIRNRLIQRQEGMKPEEILKPTSEDNDDPVNLLLGIKQAMSTVEERPSESVQDQPVEKQEIDLQTQLATALKEIAELKASLELHRLENEQLRAQQQNIKRKRRV
ncbi:HSF-type DNA-binding protein [Thraustotheca clavata]|uniref:HSF-type DNA-binding protein n=1 Tax=Thraustotheca clavata TaxID=74557 RepID=A0A1V9Y6X9_9STRA|nr:HSF-type DNA-binding protein [Thraustotheca clavata]